MAYPFLEIRIKPCHLQYPFRLELKNGNIHNLEPKGDKGNVVEGAHDNILDRLSWNTLHHRFGNVAASWVCPEPDFEGINVEVSADFCSHLIVRPSLRDFQVESLVRFTRFVLLRERSEEKLHSIQQVVIVRGNGCIFVRFLLPAG